MTQNLVFPAHPTADPLPLSDSPPPLTFPLEDLLSACTQWSTDREAEETAAGQQLVRIQEDIMGVVCMRKNMEKLLEVEALQSQHFTTIQNLVAHNRVLQETVDATALSLKRMESQQLQHVLQVHAQQNQSARFQEVVRAAASAKLELQDIQRQLRLVPHDLEVEDEQERSSLSEATPNDGSALTRQVYRQFFQDLNLREELIEEREQAFHEYQTSNHQLVEALLSQREKDQNLQRAEQEKHEQLLSVRHRFDIELERLSHHQSNLVSLYEMDLLALKKKASAAEHDLEQARRSIIALQQELVTAKKQLISLQTSADNSSHQQATAEDKLQSATLELTKLKQEKASATQQITLLKQRETTLAHQVEELTASLQALGAECRSRAAENEQLGREKDSLVSQVNEAILRSSQASKNKQELVRKLENLSKELQAKSDLLVQEEEKKKIVEDKLAREEMRTKELTQSLGESQVQIAALNTELLSMAQQIHHLQNQNTNKEIQLQQVIQTHQANLQSYLQANQPQTPPDPEPQADELENAHPALTGEEWAELKEAVSAELQKQMQQAALEVDSFVVRLSQYY